MKVALRWPRTLASRLSLIFLLSLVIAHGLSFGLQFYERYQSALALMLGNFEQDVALSVALLERLPANERSAWLGRLERPNYRYLLSEGQAGAPLDPATAPASVRTLQATLGDDHDLRFSTVADVRPHYQAHLQLKDGSPLTLDVRPQVMPLSPWLPVVLALQLLLTVICTGLAVRIAIAPLTRLAQALGDLNPNAQPARLDERGPTEVADAAMAFNALQARIAAYVKERMQLLAAISHDLQTPITRMTLRAEMMEESPEKEKMTSDLGEMQHLVQEGVAYARSMDSAAEPARRVDLDAFLDSLAFDYQDMGKAVRLDGKSEAVIQTRPQALRRVVVNLVDNALKFAGAAQLAVQQRPAGRLAIQVLDRGPGIAEHALAEVTQPFYRVEGSRNRDSGGAGLGLAIAQQLAMALGGELRLYNREGGGLCAELEL
ncbi:HAMP domain-containing sensor histidine kinase [Pseudomonas sp. RIT-PI-S]|uniref:sensor histidine kinase n=1 Tax=Pseudomonas sp. RIT-PI-S TaxID=3035295 RepID=UPI0021DA3BDD|nr:HAMP domain-containing sensor histidine kinase [Pseudomonas sp. RIT-PI-S]